MQALNNWVELSNKGLFADLFAILRGLGELAGYVAKLAKLVA